MTWFLDLRADSVGGIPAKQVMLRHNAGYYPDLPGFINEIRGRDILFGIHGFNVGRYEGIASLTGWESLLDLGNNALFLGVLWPGDSRWMPVLDYPFEDREAIHSGEVLADYVNLYFGGVASLSFVSHSLGARVALQAISKLTRKVTQLTLMAGAINDECLVARYRSTVNSITDVSVLASLEDVVLKYAFPLGNPFAGIISEGHPYWRGALGRYGPQSPVPDNLRSSWHIPNRWDFGHGDYLGNKGPKYAPPISLPSTSVPVPGSLPAWAAGFVSTRFRAAHGHLP